MRWLFVANFLSKCKTFPICSMKLPMTMHRSPIQKMGDAKFNRKGRGNVFAMASSLFLETVLTKKIPEIWEQNELFECTGAGLQRRRQNQTQRNSRLFIE